MDRFKLLMRKAFIKDYYKEIIGKPRSKQNKEYYELLKSNQMLN
jgi:hypothetical protein